MNSAPVDLSIDYALITEPATAQQALDGIGLVYETVYREPPYCETPEEAADFRAGWPRRTSQPRFRLATAHAHGETVGFGFGHGLTGDRWWSGAVGPLDVDTAEPPGRTVAIIELAVLRGYRGHGVGRHLHELLLQEAIEERVTLLVRPEPEAEAAQRLYAGLGYRRVGTLIPFDGAPTYHAMVKELRR